MELSSGGESLFSGRSRVHAITRWLQDVPPGAIALAIAVRDKDGQGAEQIAKWPLPPVRTEASWNVTASEWASKAEVLLQDYATEMRGSLQASIRWVDEGGDVVSQKRVHVRSDSSPDNFATFEASTSNALGQTMAHQQALMDTLTQVVQHSVVESGRRAEDAYRKLVELEVQNRKLAEELAEAKADAVEDAAAQAIVDHGAKDVLSERAEKLIEVILMQWLSKQSGPKLPPTEG